MKNDGAVGMRKTKWTLNEDGPDLQTILVAGVVGGLAEVLWVALYSTLTLVNAQEVARQVTASIVPSAAEFSFAPALGIAIHLALSFLVALVFALVVGVPFARRYGLAGRLSLGLAALATVWAINFFLILPVLNPAFITLMPYAATLVSKLLFGVAMVTALGDARGRSHR